jgi:hypothetical protein
MKRWKKIALVALGLVVVSQAPFAYRRYRLGQLADAIAAVNAARVAAPPEDFFDEYAGVFHVHSSLGGHSPGRPEEIVRAAKSERLAFVLMTEHPSPLLDTAAATLNGAHDGVIFVGGSELVASDGGRLFVLPGLEASARNPPLRELVARAKVGERLAVVGYPAEVGDWDAGAFDGIEVYNLYTNAKQIHYTSFVFDGLWSYWGRPELLFARFYERPDAALKKWDELNASGARRVYAFAGADAHANIGFSLGEQAGGKLLDIKLDPYERSFSLVRTHVLLEKNTPFDSDNLLEALRHGNSYLAFDVFGDPTGFRFTAWADGARPHKRVYASMGDEIELLPGGKLWLKARSPVSCRFVFFRDGQVVREVKDAWIADMEADRAGVYRVEVYLDQLGPLLEGKPWIISNPIFVR